MQKLRDISISRKLYFIVGAMAVLIIIELFTLWFAIHTLSAVRALVGGEGLWSKGQKDAMYQLGKYYRTHNAADYKAFQKYLSVPLGDHKTRMELLKEHPNMDSARQGFLEGKIHRDDIDGIIQLLQRFHSVSYVKKAIGYWAAGDTLIMELANIGERLHKEINSSSPSTKELDALLASLDPLNERITMLEDNFSYTLGEGSRWLENIILKILFAVALTVEITGLIFTISVSRAITRALNAINSATNKIAQGDLTARATVFSKDEIGQVATAVNQMTERLISFNKEMEQFAFIASHDLQEPLRKIQTFADLMLESESERLSDKGEYYIQRMQLVASRMKMLIQDLLNYSRSGAAEQKFEKTNLHNLLEQVKLELEDTIAQKNATIEAHNLGEITVNPFLFRQVFSNLLNNALRFSRPDIAPHIVIAARSATGNELQDEQKEMINGRLIPDKIYCHLTLTDNGIGFEPKFKDKMFEVFQRLHVKEHPDGTGIGLAIVRRIVERHNGVITASGEVNKGARFDIYIPKSQ